jgi:uncharacterized protein YajQ (UPF0234 family)
VPSFDVVSKVDLQEVDNALNQTRKEVAQRYDLKDSKTEITWDQKVVVVTSADDYGKVESALGGRARQTITVQQGIDSDKAREIVKFVKGSGLKVQSQILEDQVRVSGKKRDDLQAAIQSLKGADFNLALQFVNFRE